MNKEEYDFSEQSFRAFDDRYDLKHSETFIPSLAPFKGLEKELLALPQLSASYVELVTEKDHLLFERYGFVKGKKHGRYQLFFSSGSLASERWYIEDVLWGRALDYYPEGGLKREFGFKKGLLHGPFRYYDKTGYSILKGHYVDGLAHGVFRLFDSLGGISRSTSFEMGRRRGADASFTDDGYLVFLEIWDHGEKKKISFFDYIERYVQSSSC